MPSARHRWTGPTDRLQRLASSLIDARRPAHACRPELIELTTLLAELAVQVAAPQQDISGGEVRTADGLALSPTMAAMCADDYVRTIQFVRGTHAAIADIRTRFPDRLARILYVGCGPYAMLAVPLMALFSSAEAMFTLLELHPESMESAKSVVDGLGLSDHVGSFERLDAAAYRVSPAQPPDIVVMEMMRACLEAEPQVAITRHFRKQAPNAILIPEEVRVDLLLVDPAREFDLDGSPHDRSPVPRDRIFLASVFVVNQETVDSWNASWTDRLPGAAVRIPDTVEPRYQPMLFTRIRVYRTHLLEDYDSGLTGPRSLTFDGVARPGDTLQFHYELGSHPQLRCEVATRMR